MTFGVTIVPLLVGGAIFARRNVRMGRGDRKGSFQISVLVFSTMMLGWILGGHHVWDLGGEFGMFLIAFCIVWLSVWQLLSG